MGKDSQKVSHRAVRNFSCTGFLTIFVKQFTKFDTLIQIYFHQNKSPELNNEKVKALKDLARKLKTAEDEEYMGSLCRKLYHLMYKKLDGLLKRCRSRKYPLEYALILGPKWLREAEPRVHLLPVVANKMMARQPRNKSWGVWELNTELIENAIRAIKAGIPMIDPVVVRDLSNDMNIDSAIILEHWVRAIHFVRHALQSQTIAPEDSKVIDWAVADFLLMYDSSLTLVDKKTLSYKEQLVLLNDLYTLATLYNIEKLLIKKSYSELLEAWLMIYTSLKRCVINISLVYLQRMWHDLKSQARLQMQQYWRRYREPPVPDKLLQDIVSKYKHILQDPYPQWSDLVESNLVVQIKKFGGKNDPIFNRNNMDDAGPSRSNMDGYILKQPDNPISISDEIVSISSTIEDEPSNKLSSLSIDLLNNIDPSKAKISVIMESDSDEETIDASETGSYHDMSNVIEFEEHTIKFKADTEGDNAECIDTKNETKCIGAEMDNIQSIDADKNEAACIGETDNMKSIDANKKEAVCIGEIDNIKSIDADKDETKCIDTKIEDRVFADEEKHETEPITEMEKTVSINVVENVTSNGEVTSKDKTDEKLLNIPIVPLERCDLTTAWKLHFQNNTIDSRKIPSKRFLRPSIKIKSTKNQEINLPKTAPLHPELKLPEIRIVESIKEKPQIENVITKGKEEPSENNHYETRRGSRRLRNIPERKQRFRQRRIGEAQIRSALSTLSKSFLENDRNIKLLLKCRPLTIDLVRLPDRPDISPCVRTTKKIELPDIDQVRKINSTMLTAEVAPVVAQIMGNKGLRNVSTPTRTSDNDNHTTASISTETGKNLPEDDNPEPLTVEKIPENDKFPIAPETEMETTPSVIEIGLNTDSTQDVVSNSNSGNSEQNTAVTVDDNENVSNVKMVSDLHCVMESTSSVEAPNDSEIRANNVGEDLLVPKSFRIVRIVRSNDLVTSAPSKDDRESTSSGKSKSKNPNSKDEEKTYQDDDDENVKLSLVRDKLRKDLKRRAAKPAEKADANKRVFVDAYEEWLEEKNAALKYFKLPNVIYKQGDKGPTIEWKKRNSAVSAKITNTPQIIKVFSQHNATENVTVQNKVGIPRQRDRTIPLSEILKNMETQSAKQKQTSETPSVIDLTETDDAPMQSIDSNVNQTQVVSVDTNIQQTLPAVQSVPCFIAPVEGQTPGPEAIPGPSGAQNPVTSAALCPLNQFRTSLINSNGLLSGQQPTLVVTPIAQQSLTGDIQYPYVHVATIKTTSGGCFLLMPRNQNQTDGSQLPVQQNNSNTQQNFSITQQNVSNTQQNVLNTQHNFSKTQQNVSNTQQNVLNTQQYFSKTQQDVSNTQQNVLNTQHNFSKTRQNVSNTQQNVLNTQHNFSKTQQNISNTQQNVLNSQHIFSKTQQNVSNTRQNVLNTQQNFSKTQQNVSNTQQNVLNTQHNFSKTRQNVSNTQQNVLNTQHNFSKTRQNVSNTQQNVLNTKQNFSKTQQNFSNTQQNVSNTQQKVLNPQQKVSNTQQNFAKTQQNASKSRQNISNTKQHVSKKHEKVVKLSFQTSSKPRTPYVTILPKAPKSGEDSAVLRPLMPGLSTNDSEGPTIIQPPLRTYSKFNSPMKILRVDSSRPHISFDKGKLVVTTGNVPCVHPTYWSLVPNKDRIRILFPAELGGISLYNPPSVKIDKPQADNSPFSRWLRSIFSPGTDTVKGNNQPGSHDQVEPKPIARIKVKSFARMTDEDMGETQTIAPERVCIHNQLYQKFSQTPLTYAEMLTVLPDYMTAKSLIAANIPVYLLTQSGALIDKGLNELRKQSSVEFGEDNTNLVDPVNSTSADTSLKLAVLSIVNDPPNATNVICRRNSTPMDTDRPVKIKRCSMDNPTNQTDKYILGHSNPCVEPVGTNKDNDSISSGDSIKLQYVRILPNVNTTVDMFDSAGRGSASNRAQSINSENKTDGSMDCDETVHTLELPNDQTHSANQEVANSTDRENPVNDINSVTNFDHNYLARRTDSPERCDSQIEFSEVSTDESNSVIVTNSAVVTSSSP